MLSLSVDEEYSGVAEAVSLAMALLRKCKQNSWSELLSGMESGEPVAAKAMRNIDLTDEQLETIGQYVPVLELIRIRPAATPCICPVCSAYVLVSDTKTTKCLVTTGCEGKPVKIKPASAVKKEAQPVPDNEADAEDPFD